MGIRTMKRTPLLIRLLWAALVVHVIWLRLTDAHGDQGLRNAFSFISIASGLVVHWAWIILAGGLERRPRLTWLLAPPLCLAVFFSCVRFNGYSGYMIPDFSWRWAVSEAPRGITQNRGANHPTGAATSPLDYPGFLGPERRGRARAQAMTMATSSGVAVSRLVASRVLLREARMVIIYCHGQI